MKQIHPIRQRLLRFAILAVVASMPVAQAALLGTWWSSKIPNCFSAWTIVHVPNAVYVGGAGNNLAAGVWRFQEGGWARVFNPVGEVGAVNAIARDERGHVEATLCGITYSSGSEVQQYDPFTNTWKLRVAGNGAVYSSMQLADSWLLAAGARPHPDNAAAVGALDMLLANTRPSARLDDAINFIGLTTDPYAGVYVAGIYGDNSGETPEQPGLWLFDGVRFDPAHLPDYVSDIDAITSDGNGTI